MARHNREDGGAEVIELLRRVRQARDELASAMVACGIDPDDWGRLVDPSRFTTENRHHLAEVAQRVTRPLVADSRRMAR